MFLLYDGGKNVLLVPDLPAVPTLVNIIDSRS
jgi:hypothetical protein